MKVMMLFMGTADEATGDPAAMAETYQRIGEWWGQHAAAGTIIGGDQLAGPSTARRVDLSPMARSSPMDPSRRHRRSWVASRWSRCPTWTPRSSWPRRGPVARWRCAPSSGCSDCLRTPSGQRGLQGGGCRQSRHDPQAETLQRTRDRGAPDGILQAAAGRE